jgi:myxalamid-type polyketide synthase MxaB
MIDAPIAITGIGCRFPEATGPEAFWGLLTRGGDAIKEIPANRFDVDAFYDARPGIPGKLYSRWGGFLDQVDQFDPYFFGISPREAAGMDPQHRLLLEVAWEALEDAGQVPEQLLGQQVGVFVGMCTNDYMNVLSDLSLIDIYFAAGNARSVLSGRLSYALGLQGPSLVVDTACSTSLVAVHLACQSLRSGESVLALAGGANLVLLPEPSVGFCQAQMLARDGRCKAFDARGDGFVRSDGVGIIVLKRLADALADHDPIYAVIRGSAVNNDGRSGGLLMTPSRAGQEAVLREAYKNSGISPGQVQYVEAHGTGTSVGDPIEAMALGTVLKTDRPADQPCRIGSVKTNIGHAEGAAGIAGLIKVALALKHRAIPASLHFDQPNPAIPWSELPLTVQREMTPWPAEATPAVAGVSSFGISGTNSHIVVTDLFEATNGQRREARAADVAHTLPISAHSAEALEAMARAYRDVARDGRGDLADICYTASVRRTHHDHRLSVLGRSLSEIGEQLDAYFAGEPRRGVASGSKLPDTKRKIAFVFPGQGSQWLGMARRLMDQEPVFRTTLESCAQALSRYAEWSLLDEIRADAATSRLEELDVVQPVLFAVQVALAAQWRAWGVEPDAVVGHSMGEVAAAYVAGIIGLDDAARIICRRSQIVRRRASGHGRMAVVNLPLEATEALLTGYADRVAVAAINGSTTTVISGESDALDELSQLAERRDIFFQFVNVDYASHSPQMDLLRDELLESLGAIDARPTSIAMMSTSGRATLIDGPECNAAYWVSNLRHPVVFAQAIEALIADGFDVLLELSAHPTLAMSMSECLRQSQRPGIVLPSMRRDEDDRTVMLEAFGELYTAGFPNDWARLYPTGGHVVPLPAYAWQRERFWIEDSGQAPVAARKGGHPLLARYFRSAAHQGTHFWETDLSARAFPYLSDHRVQGAMVMPAAGFSEMALAAATEVFGAGHHALRHLQFQKALFLADDQPKTIQLAISLVTPGEASVKFFTVEPGEAQDPSASTLHVTGTIAIATTESITAPEGDTVEEIRGRCQAIVSAPEFYRETHEHGLEYGVSFQGLEQLWRRDGEAIGQLRLSTAVENEAGAHQVHPAFLDAAFQVLAAALPRGDVDQSDGSIFLPVGLDTLRLHARPGADLWSHAVLRSGANVQSGTIEGDVRVIDAEGHVVLEALGFTLQRVGHDAAAITEKQLGEWIYEIEWQRKARQPAVDAQPGATTARGARRWLLLSDDEVGPALCRHLEAAGDECVVVLAGDSYEKVTAAQYRINPARSEDYRQLLAQIAAEDGASCDGIVHLWAAERWSPEGATLAMLQGARRRGCDSALHLVQALAEVSRAPAPRLWVVTVGTQPVGESRESLSIAHASLWGLAGVIGTENPELRCTRVDLGASGEGEEIQALLNEVLAGDREDQVALRGSERWVPRVVRRSAEVVDEKRRLVAAEEPFRLEIATTGILDNLMLRSTTRREPGQGQVEIRVRAAGLNFRDVLVAMGLIPPVLEQSLDLGWECAGTVVRTGPGVEHLRVGEDVVALAPSCLGSYVTTDATLVAGKPAHITFEEAVTIPLTFMTAYYALHHLGRLSKGERVLIHAAAGGVGQAALQIAQHVGAEIFATAGTPEKRVFLKQQGVQHVMDSRSLEFADEVMRITGGEGVDVVLNSLAGEFIPRSLATLRAGGRFLEIGMADILQNNPLGLREFHKNLSFSSVNLAHMFVSRTEFCGTMLTEVLDYFLDGSFTPLPRHSFPLSEAPDAFRFMAQAKHIGKVVVTLDEPEFLVAPSSQQPVTFREDGTYLLTGGLGGLGLVLAEWMVERGARNLVLVGRSGATSAAAKEAVAAMQARGASVVVAKADIGSEVDVARVIGDVSAAMPPLRGIMHLAAVLDDGILLQLNQERFQTVLGPKADGAWNLHTATLDAPLDFFVMFSSMAAVLASPGQGNYVAANAFLDALAHHRRARGQAGLAINWGLWAEVGVVRPEITKRLKQQGILPFSPSQGMHLLERVLQLDSPQAMAIAVDWSRLLSLMSPPILSVLAEEVNHGSGPGRAQRSKDGLTMEKLVAAPAAERQPLIEAFLVEQIGRVLRCSPSKVDVQQPLTKLGIDSLMAVELKNRVESDVGLTVPVTALLEGPSLAQLSARLVTQLPAPVAVSEAAVPAVAAPAGAGVAGGWSPTGASIEELLSEVDDLSDDAVDSLLRTMGIDDGAEGQHSQESGG